MNKWILVLSITLAGSNVFAKVGELEGGANSDPSTVERYANQTKGNAQAEAEVNKVGCKDCVHRMAADIGMLQPSAATPGKALSSGQGTDGAQ